MTSRREWKRLTIQPVPPHCPVCGKVLDVHVPTIPVAVDRAPEPGDVCLCAGCRAVLTWTDRATLRALTTDEFTALDPRIKRELADAIVASATMHGTPWGRA